MVQISKQLYAAGNTGNFQLTKLNVNLENVRQSLLDPAKSPAVKYFILILCKRKF